MSEQPKKRDVEHLANELKQFGRRIGHHFARSEPRRPQKPAHALDRAPATTTQDERVRLARTRWKIKD